MKRATYCSFALGICSMLFLSACQTDDLKRHAELAFQSSPKKNESVDMCRMEDEILLLLQQVDKLRRIRDAHSKFYEHGDDPAKWGKFIQGLDIGNNREPDSAIYLETLRELKSLLEMRIKILDIHIKRIKEDLTVKQSGSTHWSWRSLMSSPAKDMTS